MTARANQFRLQIAETSAGPLSPLALLRWALIVIFLWSGAIQFTTYEADGVAPCGWAIMNGLHALYDVQGASHVLGVLELSIAAALILGVFLPLYSALGAALSAAVHLISLTFLLSATRITEAAVPGSPAVPVALGQFLLENLVLLAASLALLMASKTVRASIPKSRE